MLDRHRSSPVLAEREKKLQTVKIRENNFYQLVKENPKTEKAE